MSRGSSYESVEDPELVNLAKDGDMMAFEELVTRHHSRVYQRAFSMVRHDATAEDLAQQAWVKAWRRLKQFQGQSGFLTWVTRITINACLDHLRKMKPWAHAESIENLEELVGGFEHLLPPAEVRPTEQLERAELRAKMDEALAQLSDDHRTVMILHEFEEMTYKEIAEQMGCSMGTVMSRLFYARRNFAVILKDLLEGWET